MVMLIILKPDGYATKHSVVYCQRRVTIVEDEGFIYHFVFNIVSLKREKDCYKSLRRQNISTQDSDFVK